MHQKLFLVFALLMMSVAVFATQYPTNFSFEDFNAQTGQIDERPDVTNDLLFGSGDGNGTIHDHGWDSGGTGSSTRFDANSSIKTIGNYSGMIRATFGAGLTDSEIRGSSNMNGYSDPTSALSVAPGSTKKICFDYAYDNGINNSQLVVGFDGNVNAITSISSANINTQQIAKAYRSSGTTSGSFNTFCYGFKNNKPVYDSIIFKLLTNLSGAGQVVYLHLDNVRLSNGFTFQNVQYSNVGFGSQGIITAKIVWDDNGESVRDVNTRLTLNGIGYVGATTYSGAFNSSTQTFTYTVDANTFPNPGNYSFTIDANVFTGTYLSGAEFVPRQSNFYTTFDGTLNVVIPEYSFVTFTPISNVSSYRYGSIEVTPTDETQDIIFKLDSNSGNPNDVNLVINNSLQDHNQYFIFTATPAQYAIGTWILDDTLTFGSSANYDDPVQKIWDSNLNLYQHQFVDELAPLQSKYYRLSYRSPALWYSTVNNPSAWSNNYNPLIVNINSKQRDQWVLNAYTNIFSKNTEATAITTEQNLTTPSTTYEFQFNARKSTTDTVNLVVEKFNDSNGQETTLASITLSENEKRYSIPVTFLEANERLVFKTVAQSTFNQVYFSDYAFIEKSFFINRLTLLKENFDPLSVWIDVNVQSYKYIEEGDSFRFKTQYFDRFGDLQTAEIKVYANGVNDSNKIFDLDTNIFDGNQNQIRTVEGPLNGIILTQQGKVTGVKTPIKVVVTLCNSSTCYASQTGFFYLHNYPFFQSDFFLQTQEQARKLNSGPKGRLYIQSRKPQYIQYLKMKIYWGTYTCPTDFNGSFIDETLCTGTIVAPDANKIFEHYFYAGRDFNCTTSEICSFDYDLSNQFHFYVPTSYTTFTELHFNTADSNSFFSRTIFDIGKQALLTKTEILGLPYQSATDPTCYPSIYGTQLRGWSTVQELRTALAQNVLFARVLNTINTNLLEILPGYFIPVGSNPQISTDEFYAVTQAMQNDSRFQQTGQYGQNPTINNSTMVRYFDYTGCILTGTTTQAYKVIAHVATQDGEDIHQYLTSSFKLTRYDTGGSPEFTHPNRFYPIQTFFDQEKLENVIVWNTNLYDENGGSLVDKRRYRMDFNFFDQSLQHFDQNESKLFDVNNAKTYDTNDVFQIVPVKLFSVNTDGDLTMRTVIQTGVSQLDQIEVTFFTPFSTFDPQKTDKQNQIVRFNIGIEDLVKLKESPSYSIVYDWNSFNQQYPGIFTGLCFRNPASDAQNAVELLTSPFASNQIFGGAMAACLALGPGICPVNTSTPISCGTNSINQISVNQIARGGFLGYAQLNGAFVPLMNQYLGRTNKILNIRFQKLQTNDLDELKELGGFSDNNSNPQTILDDLQRQGVNPDIDPIKVTLLESGRTYTLPNNLVGVGTTNEFINSHFIRMRIVYRTNYFRSATTEIIDLADVQNASNADLLGNINRGSLEFITKYPYLIIALVVVVVLMFVFMRILPPRPRR